jgi:hypothetical protein
MSWRILGRCVEGEHFLVDGANVWEHEWRRLASGPVEIWDPAYRETYQVWPYEVRIGGQSIRFAAGETSASVWMFCTDV